MKTTVLFQLFMTAFIGSVIAVETCLKEEFPVYGGDITLGNAFSDYNFLYKQEDNKYRAALSSMELCTNSTGALIGMRATVALVIKETGEVDTTTMLNKIGTVPLDFTNCSTMTLNVTAGEYLSKIAMFYNN